MSRIFPLKGKMRETLMSQAKLLYDIRYSEYYANVVWAQMLSFVFLGMTVGVIMAGAANSVLFLVFGIVASFVFGYYFINHISKTK